MGIGSLDEIMALERHRFIVEQLELGQVLGADVVLLGEQVCRLVGPRGSRMCAQDPSDETCRYLVLAQRRGPSGEEAVRLVVDVSPTDLVERSYEDCIVLSKDLSSTVSRTAGPRRTPALT